MEERRHMNDEKQKELYKQAWKELLDEYVLKFGWFSIATITLLIIGALVYFVLTNQGWIAPETHAVVQQQSK